MITFERFFYLRESTAIPFNGISPSKLGFHNTILDLPDEKPYGFWVDAHGNFIPVTSYRHAEIAVSVYLKTLSGVPKIRANIYPPGGDYEFMLNNGCIRVICGNGGVYYSTFKHRIITGGQMKFIKFIMDLYDMSESRFDPYV